LSHPVADDVRERLVRIYTSLSPGGRLPSDNERGELDSMAFLEFIVLIEREFSITVETSDLDEANFATTTTTTAFVRHKLNGRGS
jgi:phosphopantetheine binding protein